MGFAELHSPQNLEHREKTRGAAALGLAPYTYCFWVLRGQNPARYWAKAFCSPQPKPKRICRKAPFWILKYKEEKKSTLILKELIKCRIWLILKLSPLMNTSQITLNLNDSCNLDCYTQRGCSNIKLPPFWFCKFQFAITLLETGYRYNKRFYTSNYNFE